MICRHYSSYMQRRAKADDPASRILPDAPFKRDQHLRLRLVLPVVLTVSLLGGCAVLPSPLLDEARLARIDADFGAMFADQEPVSGAIDLGEAVARGLKYNLDKRLKLMERGLADERLGLANAEMLPAVVADAGYRERDSFRGSSSQSLITGRQSLEVSTSEDKAVRNGDLEIVWNILDFGLSYLRAQQDADRVLIAEERRIKVVQNMILDIRDAFWRAAAAQILLPEVDRLIAELKSAVRRSDKIGRSGDADPAAELKQQRVLIEHQSELVEVRRRLLLARSQLAALMNLPPSSHYTLSFNTQSLPLPAIGANVADLEQLALLNRPELREEDYTNRISLREVDAAYVRLLPGIELRAGRFFDSNSFLLENHWNAVAAVLTKNLVELATAGRSISFAEQGVRVAQARRLALSMAVIAQVHIALRRFQLATDSFEVNQSLYRVDAKLEGIASRNAAGDGGAAVAALEARSKRTVSRLRVLSAYASVQNAYGRVLNSIGAHRPPEEIEQLDLATLSSEVRIWLDSAQPVNNFQTASYDR